MFFILTNQKWLLPSLQPAVSPYPPAASPVPAGIFSAAHLSLSGGTPPWQQSPVHM